VSAPSETLRAHPLVFVEDLEAPHVDDADRHHLSRVLRVRDGETVCLADGHGRWRSAVWGPTPSGLGNLHVVHPPSPSVCVGVVVPKGDRAEFVVQKLVELGVDRVVLLHSDRSVVRWEAGAVSRRLERLRRVARGAAMQSRQPRLARVDGVLSLPEFVAEGSAEGVSVALAEPGGGPLGLGTPWVAVGPEGGWSPTEVSAVATHVGLGSTVLRVETAAVVVGGLLAGLRGGWVTGHAG
jgi:16S rRNA (uracil1498-N3)-methyltransferase